MPALPFLLALAAQSALPSAATTPPPPVPCADTGGLLPGSGLCRAEALARLPKTQPGGWNPPQGCDTAAQEAQLPGGRWLLYAALRCGERIARLAVTPQQGGALVLRYAETARNAELAGRKTLTIVIGRPAEEHLAVYTLVTGGLTQQQAQRCALRTPPAAGYPWDAFVFDLPPADARLSAALDQPCGPYGRSARTDSYWRLFSGIGVFHVFGDDQPEYDPASLTVYQPGR
ncbi:hypothetical protein [Novosphingobium sp.]|uniref:hypothetical protein n=1 Tax=Novosphingobium sp. TaxID=1874826 RepID=UPI003BA90390